MFFLILLKVAFNVKHNLPIFYTWAENKRMRIREGPVKTKIQYRCIQNSTIYKIPPSSTGILSLQSPDKLLAPDDRSDLSFPWKGLESDADINLPQGTGQGERHTVLLPMFPFI